MKDDTPEARTVFAPDERRATTAADARPGEDLDQHRVQRVVENFFLHIHPGRVHRHTLRVATTLGLGVISLILFVILAVTGVMLMVYYKPSVEHAYDSIKDIHYVVPAGRITRNIHRWAAHAMVVTVILHMARVFYTGAYKRGRWLNWLLGLSLLLMTMLLSFTGYLLPWDQLAYWAVTIGSHIAQSPRELTDLLGLTAWFDPGRFVEELLLGAHEVGEEGLLRFYVLHVYALPMAMVIVGAVHLWRVRRDGGIARPSYADALAATPTDARPQPKKTYMLLGLVRGRTAAVDQAPEATVPTWPYLMYAEALLFVLTLGVLLVVGYYVDAPLRELADPLYPENPAKAPWYFLSIQELVSYSALIGGVIVPAVALAALALVPFVDREKEEIGVWWGKGRRTTLLSFIFATAAVAGTLAATIGTGWQGHELMTSSRLVMLIANPGTVLLVLGAVWSLGTTWITRSRRRGAIAMFTCWFVWYAVLTYVAVVHRGPDWDFYWSPAEWSEQAAGPTPEEAATSWNAMLET